MGAIDSRYMMVPARGMPADVAVPAAIIDLRGIGQTLWRRRLWIAVPALVLGGIALLAALSLNPRYEAAAKILLDPRGIQVLQNDLRPPNAPGEESAAEVESQVQVLASTRVLEKVIERLNLTDDPDFYAPKAMLPARILAGLAGLFSSQAETEASRRGKVLRALQNSVSVMRSNKTFVLDIVVSTPEAEKSARIANAIGAAFIEETGEVRSETSRRAGGELSARLDTLHKRLQRSEEAVETYRRTNNLVSANGRLVVEQQLADLNGQLTLARTRVTDQESRVQEIKRLARKGTPADALTEATNSATISNLRTQYADATRVEAEAKLNYGPRHPAMVAAAQQVQVVRQRIAEEVARIARAAETDLERAQSTETSILRRIDALKRESSAQSQAQVRLRELDRQAAADRTIYENFLNRSKDLQERQTVDTGTTRMITPAVAPIGRAGLSRMLLVLGGLGFGAVMGVGAALLREQFDGTIRSGQQVAAETHLPVLTVSADDRQDDEALRRVRNLLAQPTRGGRGRMVLIAGLGAAAARTDLAQRLARMIHHAGERTVLVDGDASQRTLTRTLRAEQNLGLTDLLAAAPQEHPNALRFFNGLRVITAGTPGTAEVRNNRRAVQAALGPFLDQGGFIIVDGGSVGPDLQTFAAMADDIVLVVEGGRVPLHALRTALDSFGPDTDQIRGIVLAGTLDV